MKFTIGTAKLNTILSKVNKGVGNSKILPVTQFLSVSLADRVLRVTATNSVHFITYIEKDIEGESGSALIEAEKLIKLAARTTKPEMTLELKDSYIEVKGNGTYKVPVYETDEFPTYAFKDDVPCVEVELAALKKVFSVNKASIATDLNVPYLTGYNIGNKCVTTDGVKMCVTDIAVFNDTASLIPQNLADLINTMSDEKVFVQKVGSSIRVESGNIIVFGTELNGLDQYPDIAPVVQLQWPNVAKVSKDALTSALDRLSLFADPFDNHGIRLNFKSDNLTVEDLKQNSVEVLEYTEKVIEDEVEAVVNISYFQELLAVVSGAIVELGVADGLPLKIVDGNVTQILSVLNIGE